jgi:hypothetical protein
MKRSTTFQQENEGGERKRQETASGGECSGVCGV